MKRTLILILLPSFLLSFLFWSCRESAPTAAAEGDSLSHDGTTHSLGNEEASIAATTWTEDLELFMEHPVLRVGRQAKFAVHLTKLSDFRPVSRGPILFRFVKHGAAPKIVTVGNPEVPGIFGPSLTFEEAGDYELQLEILSDEIETSLQYSHIAVLDETQAPPTTEEQAAGQTIAFLKEQQWKLPFASAVAGKRRIHETFRVPAEIKARAGTDSLVTPAISGRYVPPANGIPSLGMRVREGTLLGYVELLPVDRSSLIDSQVGAGISVSRLIQDVARAEALVSEEQARLELAEKEVQRVGALVKAEALPTKRLDEAHTELAVRRASLRAANDAVENYRMALSRYDRAERLLDSFEQRLPLHAPVSGQLVESRAVAGQYVDARDTLFRIVDLSVVWAEGQVYENDLARLENLQGGTLDLPGLENLSLKPDSLILIGSALDPAKRTLPIVFEVENPERRIKLGTLGQLDLQAGTPVQTLAAPRSAVLLEENREIVYVQLGGETFERRPVTTGIQDRQWIQIVEGLEEGDRIVTVGAYNVALAARSTETPDHGHVH